MSQTQDHVTTVSVTENKGTSRVFLKGKWLGRAGFGPGTAYNVDFREGTITIDVLNLYLFVNSGTFTDANVVITSDAAAATWTGVVSGDGGVNQIITLTSTGGNTTVGENITVTFTGVNL